MSKPLYRMSENEDSDIWNARKPVYASSTHTEKRLAISIKGTRGILYTNDSEKFKRFSYMIVLTIFAERETTPGMKRPVSLLSIILSTVAFTCNAQVKVWRAPVESALSNSSVTAIEETTDGYIWIGTQQGLNKFNGTTYNVFYQGDTLALSNDRIWCLCHDTGNRLWVGTSAGINLIADSKVVRRPTPRFDAISAIANYSPEKLVYGGYEGVLTYDKATGETQTILSGLQYPSSILVTLDKKVVCSGKNGTPEIRVLDTSFNLSDNFTIPGINRINGIAQAKDGTIVFATDKGILAFNNDLEEIPGWNKKLEDACGIKNPDVIFISYDLYEDNITAGISGGKIYSISTSTGEISHSWYNVTLEDAKEGMAILTRDNLWYSTDVEPLSHDIRGNDIFTVTLKDLPLHDKVVWTFRYEGNRALVLTYSRIFLVNLNTGSYRDITPAQEKSIGQWIYRSCLDAAGDLWIVTNSQWVKKYNLNGSDITGVKEWKAEQCPAIWANPDGSICYIDGSYLYTISSDGERYGRPMSRSGSHWRAMPSPSSDKVFLSLEEKIYQYSQDRLFIELPYTADATSCVSEDPQGRIWIGSLNSGLTCIDPSSGETKEYTISNGMPDNNIRSIIFDDRGTWVSTRNAIVLINGNDQILPIQIKSSNPMNYVLSASTTGDSGQIVFGADNAIVILYPSTRDIPEDIPINLDAILVNNSEYPDFGKELVLNYDQNLIVFYFSAKDYVVGEQLNFAYKLEGLDSQWIVSENKRGFFSNLNSGKYRFFVRVQTPDGVWHEPKELIRLRIKPAPWLTMTAKLFYALFGAALLSVLILLYNRNRRNRERAERSEMEKAVGEQMNRDKTDFFMNISHEYRTPLSLIYGPARELSRNNNLDEHDKHLVRLIERNAEKMMTLTEQVVNFDRFSRSSDHLAVLRTDLGKMLRKIYGNFEYLEKQKNLTISFAQSKEDFPPVWCDRDKIEKIFFNILSNAIKYTPEGGNISINLSTLDSVNANVLYNLPESQYEGTYAEVSVADSGVGIDPDEIKRIFNRFERLGKKVGDKIPEGLGIGLNHVLYLVGLHRGAISVKRNEPKGAIFSFVIPMEKEAYSGEEIWREVPYESTGRISETVPVQNSDKSFTVLIAEDDKEMRTYLHDLFKGSYNVMLATDGEEAMRFIKISAPDIIVSDVMMPYKDGFQLCKEIKESEEFSHLPVVLLTAKSQASDSIEGLGYGADSYVQKPFDPQYLQALVKSILENRLRIQHLLKDKTNETIEEVLPELQMDLHDKQFIEKMYKFVEDHISEEDLNVTSLADFMGMSRSGLFSKVKTLTGQSPQEFLINYRLNAAKKLILSRDYNVSEVAYMVGFSTLNGFSRAFKNKFGVPPSSL